MADTQKTEAPSTVGELQKRVDEAEAQGFYGIEVDPTPNAEYSMQKPDSWKVPEADPKAAAKAGSSRFQGVSTDG
jgi:hypothetical protein